MKNHVNNFNNSKIIFTAFNLTIDLENSTLNRSRTVGNDVKSSWAPEECSDKESYGEGESKGPYFETELGAIM